jgi:cytochrome c553
MALRLNHSVLIGLSLIAATAARAEDPTPEQLEFFEKRVRPVLVTNCYECHGEGRAKGGLRLTTGEMVRRGGDSGAAIVPGNPDESLLIEAIGQRGDIKMPPKQKLADSEISDLRRWIEIGAPWPAEKPDARPETAPFQITPEQRAFWSFQPVRDAAAPDVKDETWPAGAIDRFVLARLESEGLSPSPPADKRALIRRVTFDLIGLPPTPEEVDAFIADDGPLAWERLVDRLLASPRYGERWARHWLDVARFGEDQAHTFQARMYPNGYRYRDWVVESFNNDLPYDKFVVEQIAGDLLEGPEEKRREREIALGYFALGPVYYADAGCAFKASLDELDDRLDTLARGFLGLTIACARCHDHKFDPISQHDYYALAGVFRSSSYREAPLVAPDVVEKYDAAQKQAKDEEQKLKKFMDGESTRLAEETARQSSRYLTAVWRLAHPPAGSSPAKRETIAREERVIEVVLDRWLKFLVPENRDKVPQLAAWFELIEQAATLAIAPDVTDVPGAVVEAALGFEAFVESAFAARDEQQRRYSEAVAAAPEAERSKIEKPNLDKPLADLLATLAGPKGLCSIPADKIEGLLNGPRKGEMAALKQKVDELKKGAPPKYAFAHSLSDGQPANMKLHVRGNPNRTGDEVPRRFLAILADGEPAPFSQGSGRLELARSIASADNPLTARVIVNRLWHEHFGRGIVATPSNFGAMGERPTHPELLDYLAGRLVSQGWSLKAVHREILLSAAYRQSSAIREREAEIDPDNRLLWRMNRRRLDVEAWRDALLATAGNLDPAIGGPSGKLAAADFLRRTLYGTVSRHNLDGLLRLFDFPDPNITSERRTVTTVPLQQLFVLNSDFMVRQAKALAARATSVSAGDDAARIRQVYRLLFGRDASDAEVQVGLEFLAPGDVGETTTAEPSARKSTLTRWEQYAQVLLSANEFTFVD